MTEEEMSQPPISPTENDSPSPVFLLGAGFSRAISGAMPMLSDLSRLSWQAYGDKATTPADVAALLQTDIEDGLSYLLQSKPWLRESVQLRHRAMFLELSLAVAAVIAQAEKIAISDFTSGNPDWINALIEFWDDQRCCVITLNYDTLVERFASEFTPDPSKPSWRPCSIRNIYPPYLTHAATRSTTLLGSGSSDTMQLLKLHGSVNWYYSGREHASGETVFYTPPRGPHAFGDATQLQHERRNDAVVSDKYPFIVPPVFDKTALLTHESVRAMWSEASHALQRADEVYCVGYSLPKTDRVMHHFLRSSLRKDVQLKLVSPDQTLIEHYQRSLDLPNISHAHTGTECVREMAQALSTSLGSSA